jgi:Tol biopolymer transport system component/DNA-binding winged helix-turn-helix (wHTH) protein
LAKEHALRRFGEYSLDPVAKVLFRNGEPVHMTRKAVETLLVLVENAGQVLTKEEIMSAVWSDRVVDEANLAQNIAVIRKTLGASKGSPAYIETFPGRGYRLEGPVLIDTQTPPPAAAQDVVAAAEEPVATNVVKKSRGSAWLAVAIAGVVVAAVAAFLVWRQQARETETEFRVVPVTRLAGREYQPALAPDGKSVAFLWAEEGSSAPSVWAAPSREGSPRQISRVQAHHSSPEWSADGSQIAYLRLRSRGTEVVVAPAAGGDERVVTTLAPPDYGFESRMLSWSPDGASLAISHSDSAGRPPGIWLVSVATGEARPMTRPGPAATGDLDPRFSPDGKRVSFVRMIHRSRQEVYWVPVAGGEAVQATTLGKRISSHDWLADGKTLLVASDHAGEFRVWRYDTEARRAVRPTGIYSEFPIQFSLGRKAGALVYASLYQDRNIWRFELREGSWKRVIATTAQDASPVYSPRGDRISFRSDRSGEEQLWVSDADGSNPVQVTRGETKASVGRWFPDGTALVFNNPQTFDIYIARQSGGAWSATKTGSRGVHPVFSTDGKWIFAGGSSLMRTPVAGGPSAVLSQSRGEALQASPDGKYVYFMREPNDTTVWRVPVTGGEPERAFDGIVPGCTSCWSLSLDGVYYLGMDRESFDRQALFFHSFDGKTPDRMIAPYPEPLWPQGSGPFSLAPDRSNLLCVRVGPSNSDVMLVTPFE